MTDWWERYHKKPSPARPDVAFHSGSWWVQAGSVLKTRRTPLPGCKALNLMLGPVMILLDTKKNKTNAHSKHYSIRSRSSTAKPFLYLLTRCVLEAVLRENSSTTFPHSNNVTHIIFPLLTFFFCFFQKNKNNNNKKKKNLWNALRRSKQLQPHENKHFEGCVYLGESLADVKKRWSCNRVSEVWSRKQQCSHLQVNHLKTQRQKKYRLEHFMHVCQIQFNLNLFKTN